MVGGAVGDEVGLTVGEGLGDLVGVRVGEVVGRPVGEGEGGEVGTLVGAPVGDDVDVVGAGVGKGEGETVGERVGDGVGPLVGDGVGRGVGVRVGESVSGTLVTISVCVSSSPALTFTFTCVVVNLLDAMKTVKPWALPTVAALSSTGGGGSCSPASYSTPSAPTTMIVSEPWLKVESSGIAWKRSPSVGPARKSQSRNGGSRVATVSGPAGGAGSTSRRSATVGSSAAGPDDAELD